jgi:CheY-like chemotaxis protein
MEVVGQLAAGVAHDFNNILTVIQGHAGLLNQLLSQPGPHRKSIDEITRATGRASNLIRQLLMFSRKQVMQFYPLDLNDVIGNATGMLRRLVGEHITVDFQPEPGLPAVKADHGMIEQVLMNLVVNARDAMPKGGRVLISTCIRELNREASFLDPEPRLGHFICLRFADTGCGMDASVLNHLFEPFFTTKDVGKGTGLGLASVYGIVKQHRGWIEVESAVGQGTTFQIFLPISVRPVQKLDAAPPEEPSRPGKETILIAEDEAPLRQIVAKVLSRQGYTVLEAASGREALRLSEGRIQSVDLLLTDMVMPEGVMGRELAERLRELNPRLKVIFTSGYSPDMAGKEFSPADRGSFLPKPYSPGTLTHLVRECLDSPVAAN